MSVGEFVLQHFLFAGVRKGGFLNLVEPSLPDPPDPPGVGVSFPIAVVDNPFHGIVVPHPCLADVVTERVGDE
jgi:hypothetical protein